MATKKKTVKKSTRSSKISGGKAKPAKKQARKPAAPGKSAKKTAAPNKAGAKKKGVKKMATGKTASVSSKKSRKKGEARRAFTFSPGMSGSHSGEQSGDMQGLSTIESADSESVDELMEEGNAFEAGVVSGVQDAEKRSEREVYAREVLEDDVPGEYLDKE
ncbi:MAG TPA: hypothetical protein VKY85_02565 [Candidatus Angelobacter sp.]|nr:hypothetical protein [Candidatus Angelobacter sp.]